MNDTFVELAVAILATAIESDEIFNIDKNISETIIASMKANKTWPEIEVYVDGDRIKYGVKLVEMEEK
jgi:hypothetical protein